MSKLNGLYVLYDTVAEESGPIFECKNLSVAIRAYDNFMIDAKNPNDFLLVKVGEIDREGQCRLIPGNESEIIDISQKVVDLTEAVNT